MLSRQQHCWFNSSEHNLKLLNYERKDMSRYNYPASTEVVDVVGQLRANPLAIHGIKLFTM